MTAKSFNLIPNRCFTPVLIILLGNIKIKLPEHIERNCNLHKNIFFDNVLFQLSFFSDRRILKRRFKAKRWATTAPILYRSTLRALPTKPRVTSSTAQRLSGQKISETIRSKIIRDYYQVKNIQTLSGQNCS